MSERSSERSFGFFDRATVSQAGMQVGHQRHVRKQSPSTCKSIALSSITPSKEVLIATPGEEHSSAFGSSNCCSFTTHCEAARTAWGLLQDQKYEIDYYNEELTRITDLSRTAAGDSSLQWDSRLRVQAATVHVLQLHPGIPRILQTFSSLANGRMLLD